MKDKRWLSNKRGKFVRVLCVRNGLPVIVVHASFTAKDRRLYYFCRITLQVLQGGSVDFEEI